VEQSPDAVAAGVSAILADPDAARQMGRRGRALAVGEYGWARAASALISEYEAIAADTIQVV
jgi:glycosyltransferase involved in cell wall biosynthesis